MKPEEYQNEFNQHVADMEGQLFFEKMIALAEDVLMTIRTRVREHGIDSNGVPYKDYTPEYKRKKMGITRRRVYEEGTRVTKKNKRTGKALLGLPYPNRYKGFTDFDYTGRMWTDTKVLREESTNSKIVIGTRGIDAGGVSNLTKLEANTKRFGLILQPSKGEEEIIAQTFKMKVNELRSMRGLTEI